MRQMGCARGGMRVALIYIVEDDASIGELIAASLGAAGHEARVFGRAEPMEAAVKDELPALLLLDIMLPGKDGFTILEEWRQDARTRPVPVIVLSARGEELSKVRGLELGAEDYITKPFGVLELQARVKTALRRNQAGADVFQLSDLTVDFLKKEVRRGGELIQLTRKEYQLLEYLCRHPALVVSREQLLKSVWDYHYEGDTTRTVDYHIRALRRKLGDSAEDSRYIQTVRGFGYRMRG